MFSLAIFPDEVANHIVSYPMGQAWQGGLSTEDRHPGIEDSNHECTWTWILPHMSYTRTRISIIICTAGLWENLKQRKLLYLNYWTNKNRTNEWSKSLTLGLIFYIAYSCHNTLSIFSILSLSPFQFSFLYIFVILFSFFLWIVGYVLCNIHT